KMSTIASAGRTVLFVSHNIGAIRQLTQKCLFLDQGRRLFYGPTEEAVEQYNLKTAQISRAQPLYLSKKTAKPGAPIISKIAVTTSTGASVHRYPEPLTVAITVSHPEAMRNACLSLQIFDGDKNAVVLATAYSDEIKFAEAGGETLMTCTLPQPRLNVGSY